MTRRTRRTVFALVVAGLSAAGCVGAGAPPPEAETVSFNSRDAVFIDDLAAGGSLASNADRPISGLLTLPAREGNARVPAVIILHTSSGPSALEWGHGDHIEWRRHGGPRGRFLRTARRAAQR